MVWCGVVWCGAVGWDRVVGMGGERRSEGRYDGRSEEWEKEEYICVYTC